MEEVVIEVDGFKGPSYGKGIVVFYRDGVPVQYGINANAEYNGVHRLMTIIPNSLLSL